MAADLDANGQPRGGQPSEGRVDERLDALITTADLDGLVRLVDARCAASDWSGLLHLRDRSRWAVSTGRQLWPAATLAEYRLALLAPSEWAAQVLHEDTGTFSIGPLTEVIAQSHSWESLQGLLPVGPRAAFVAHERVLRGDTVDASALQDVLEIPFALQDWEPVYPEAVYTADSATFDAPELPTVWTDLAAPDAAEIIIDEGVTLAVRQLVEPWTAESNGRAEVVCVEGTAAQAVAALATNNARLAPITSGHALQWMAWAGASGGAFGRRRGGALGRFGAWWLIAALGDTLDDWPLAPQAMGQLANELRWYWWDSGAQALGWQLQLAVELPTEGLAWAINASDTT